MVTRLVSPAALVVLLLVGCGDSATAPSDIEFPDGVAFLVVRIPPSDATPSSNTAFRWAANFTVTLIERAGVGVQLSEIVVELQPPVVFDTFHISGGIRPTRVEALGTLSVPLSLAFSGVGLNARVAIRGVDDRNNPIEVFGTLVVVPAQGP